MKPLTVRRTFLLVLFMFLGMGVVVATQIHHRTLEQVVKPTTLILEAELVESQRHRSPMWEIYNFEIRESRFLIGPKLEVTRVRLCNPMPHDRTVDGKIRRISPLHDASGFESDLKEGERYLFLAQVAPENGQLEAVRIEPLERMGAIARIFLKSTDYLAVRIQGKARNAKLGGVILTESLGPVYINEVDDWGKTEGKMAWRTGFLREIPSPEPADSDSDVIKATIQGPRWALTVSP